MYDQPIPVKQVIRIQKQFARLYLNTGLVAIGSDRVNISVVSLTDIAPLGDWTLNQDRHNEDYPYRHTVVVDGVTFISISEKAVVNVPATAGIEPEGQGVQ